MSKIVAGPHDELTYKIIGAAFAVHRRLGPGYREEIYQRALGEEFNQVGLSFEPLRNLPVYDGEQLLGYYIPDFIVEEKVIVEIKAFARLHQRYVGQVVTYLNFTGLLVGLLLNFGERKMRPHRIFPSNQESGQHIYHDWLFVPDWLKDQKKNMPTSQPERN